MRSSIKFLKAFLRLLLLMGVVFLIVEASDNGGRKLMKHHLEEKMGREKHGFKVVSRFDLNYTSKRRIPNGPDPIHNRRAGNSHQPPGQS